MLAMTSAVARRHIYLLRSAALAGALSLSVASLVGCESQVEVADGGACCEAAPACPEGAIEVAACATADCFSVEACCSEILCEPGAQCTLAPACDGYETQVESCEGLTTTDCHSVSACGVTIFCSAEEFCPGVAMCDAGDDEVGECPADGACYTAELCGESVLCWDVGLAHGCPETIPASGSVCSDYELLCDYPINGGDCFESWQCQASLLPDGGLIWQHVGGGCSGSG